MGRVIRVAAVGMYGMIHRTVNSTVHRTVHPIIHRAVHGAIHPMIHWTIVSALPFPIGIVLAVPPLCDFGEVFHRVSILPLLWDPILKLVTVQREVGCRRHSIHQHRGSIPISMSIPNPWHCDSGRSAGGLCPIGCCCCCIGCMRRRRGSTQLFAAGIVARGQRIGGTDHCTGCFAGTGHRHRLRRLR